MQVQHFDQDRSVYTSIGIRMISSAFWEKLAQVNLSKNLQVLIYPKFHEKNDMITC